MASFPLSSADFQEILSSLLMADMPYEARLEYSSGPSLTPDFAPNSTILPKLESAIKTIQAMFGVSFKVEHDATLTQWAERLHREWEVTDQQITFYTSGSTGHPKGTTQDIRLHEQEVGALAKAFKGRKRIVSFVPRHHIYGFLFSILLPKAMDIPVEWQAPLPMPGLFQTLQSGDLIVAFPLLWSKLVEMETSFNAGIHGVTSTGPCPAATIQALRENGLERMYEIYGSSETGGVGYRSDTNAGYTLLPHWSTSGNDATLTRQHPELGRIQYALQDELQWKGATFTPSRRIDDGVQVAGINVYPSRVREILLTHPEVKECAIRLMRPDEGNRLKALIVPKAKSDASQLESTIRAWTKAHLSPYEMPGAWSFAAKLPANAMGKLQDW